MNLINHHKIVRNSEIENHHCLHINRLPARTTMIPALQSGVYYKNKEQSELLQSLNGDWQFSYQASDCLEDFYEESYDVSAWDSIDVPSMWQYRVYGRPTYPNVEYPIPFNPPYVCCENPVGYYKRSFCGIFQGKPHPGRVFPLMPHRNWKAPMQFNCYRATTDNDGIMCSENWFPTWFGRHKAEWNAAFLNTVSFHWERMEYEKQSDCVMVKTVGKAIPDYEYLGFCTEITYQIFADGEGLSVIGCDSFSFAYQEFSQTALDKAKHRKELQKSDCNYLYVNYQTRGLGSRSCGPDPEPEFELYPHAFEFAFVMTTNADSREALRLVRSDFRVKSKPLGERYVYVPIEKQAEIADCDEG